MPTAAERVSDFFFLKREREKGREREKSNVVFDLTFLFSTFKFFFFFFFNTVSQPEIEGLYRRFRALDKGHKGYISADEFLSIPELSINPLAKRLERVFESVNFKEFVGFLAAFSPRASREAKVRLIFAVFDADGDGVVSRSDLELCVRQLVGGSMGEEGVAAVVASALEGAAANKRKTAAGAGAGSAAAAATAAAVPANGDPAVLEGLTLDDVRNALSGRELAMDIEFPTMDD